MKIFDFEKIKYIVEQSKDFLDSASIGMSEDWFWTASTLFEDGGYLINNLEDYRNESGITGSVWATPALLLVYNDGSEQMFDVSKGESDKDFDSSLLFWASGCLSGPTQERLPQLKQFLIISQ